MQQRLIRLSKFLADSGVASRRKADFIVADGRVTVNNITILTPFTKVNPHKDIVTVDNKTIPAPPQHKYIALYKPQGYLSDLADPRNRRLARDLLADQERLFPVGRLDFHSEGLMLFTNDGEFANLVMHPRHQVEKEYVVKLKGTPLPEDIGRALHGVLVDGVRYAFDDMRLIRSEQQSSWFRIIVHEGKNRMVRKIADVLGHPVIRLRRVRIGPVHLGRMRPGAHRPLTQREVAYFRSHPQTAQNLRSTRS